ncbi:MAG: DUF3786 domain-containing protein, partial [Candidatus Omnitrophica bacterium]|nr:DUF3786 domain-containing protein [Candidatus Omnitrophota bacterium]
NAPPKEHIQIILLHYLIQKLRLKVLPHPKGEWIDFRQIPGGEVYFPAFRKRVIEVLIRKYGKHPEGLLERLDYFPAKRVQTADVGIIIEVFDNVPLLICLYRADEEFLAEANVLFDENISEIFCTEDIVVLADIVVHLL